MSHGADTSVHFIQYESIISAVCGFAVALILGIKQKGLIVVAAAACVTVFVVEWILKLM